MSQRNIAQRKKLNQKKIVLFVFLIITIIFIILKVSKTPKISLKGPATVNIPLNSVYSDEGAFATYGQKDISSNIQVTNNNFSTNKVGTYEITYTINHKKKSTNIKRIVNVIDSESPTLTLNGESEINIAQNSTYQDLGCYAVDNYDGDITTKISIENNINTSNLGTYSVNYKVKDSSGNESSISRKVNVVSKNSKNISKEKSTGIPVLMYHFFYDKNNGDKGTDGNYMEIHDFEEQLKYLTENNYYFPTWEEVNNYVRGTSCLPKHSIVLTVDDGNPTFFDLAVPVIQKYNVKVTSFVVTSWIQNSDYLKQFDSTKISFQSHSHDMHRAGTDGKGRFLTLSHDEAYSDVTTSQSFIGNATVFCYPFGHYSDSSEQVLQDANYQLAFTTQYGRIRPGDNPYELTRIRMSKGDSLNTFIKRVS